MVAVSCFLSWILHTDIFLFLFPKNIGLCAVWGYHGVSAALVAMASSQCPEESSLTLTPAFPRENLISHVISTQRESGLQAKGMLTLRNGQIRLEQNIFLRTNWMTSSLDTDKPAGKHGIHWHTNCNHWWNNSFRKEIVCLIYLVAKFVSILLAFPREE